MDAALWAAKTGLDAQQTEMSVISNNLANVNTTGYKEDRAVFEDLLYQNQTQVGADTSQTTQSPSGMSIGTGVEVVATEKEYGQGTPTQTGNPLDVAISGPGILSGPDARRHPRLHPRRHVPEQRPGPARHLDRICGAARHHDSAGRSERHDRQRRHRHRAAAGPVEPHPGRAAAAREFHQSRRACSRSARTCWCNRPRAARRRPEPPE